MYQGRKGTKSGRTGYIEILNAAHWYGSIYILLDLVYPERERRRYTRGVGLIGGGLRSEDERHGEH